MEADEAQYFAMEGGRVIGWCDILRKKAAVFSHAGVMGLGVLEEYRGKGIGSRLIDATLSKARENGLERIELTVFSSNIIAIRLYEKFGFRLEGKLEKAVKIEGVYQDLIYMAIL